MLGRQIQVGLVNTNASEADGAEGNGPSFEEKTEIVSKHIERVIRKIGIAVVVYVVVDTARKVAVKQATPG